MKRNEYNDVVKKYKEDIDKYEHLKRKRLMNAKESKTLELLEAFKERLFNAKNKPEEDEEVDKISNDQTKTELETILTHKLDVDEEIKQKVIDANIKEADRYDIFDPRNVINKRKRGEYNEPISTKSSRK
jgi:peptidyl-prolyl cis-trans isomerase SDCCAG10